MDGRVELKLHPKHSPGPTPKELEEVQKNVLKNRRSEAIQRLTQAHNAIPLNLPEKAPLFSIHLERYFDELYPKPVVFTSWVLDIGTNGEGTKITFGSDSIWDYEFSSSSSPKIHFTLDCPVEEIHKLEEEKELWEVAVVGVISSIQKVPYEAKAAHDENATWLRIKPSNIFIASGKCLELLPLSEKGIWDYLGISDTPDENTSIPTRETQKWLGKGAIRNIEMDLDGNGQNETIKEIWSGGVSNKNLTLEIYSGETLISVLSNNFGIQPNYKIQDRDGDGKQEIIIWNGIWDPRLPGEDGATKDNYEGHSSPHRYVFVTYKLIRGEYYPWDFHTTTKKIGPWFNWDGNEFPD